MYYCSKVTVYIFEDNLGCFFYLPNIVQNAKTYTTSKLQYPYRFRSLVIQENQKMHVESKRLISLDLKKVHILKVVVVK